ncbi:MAG: sigma 54-interacting transcriptional regulator [Myxococcota bacterium]
MARRVAHRNVPVLIEGESGTGKELIARACHAEGPRRHQPFVAINCGAIPPELVESELFGHVKGAFTGAARDRPGHFRAAHSGTLFLDEVGELPLATQVKLLRVLQEGEVTPIGASQPLPVDVRVIAATHRRLLDACRDGHFRFDLFYRLAVAVIVLPPLRARPGDLRLLIDTVTEELSAESHRLSEPAPRLTTGALAVLQGHRWPGNVRELRNVLRRAHLWSEGGLITEEDAREALLGADDAPVVDPILNRPLGEDLSLPDVLSEVARHYLTRALAEADGNKSRAARLVGLSSYQTLDNWLARHVGRSEGSEGER